MHNGTFGCEHQSGNGVRVSLCRKVSTRVTLSLKLVQYVQNHQFIELAVGGMHIEAIFYLEGSNQVTCGLNL